MNSRIGRAWVVLGALLSTHAGTALAQAAPPSFSTLRFLADQPSLPTSVLRLGVGLNGKLRGGDVRRYELSLDANTFAAVRIPQIAGNVVPTVFDPDGKLINIVDESGEGQAEVITINVTKAGQYHIQIAMFEWDAPDADYSIELIRKEPAAQTQIARARQLFESWYSRDLPGGVLLVVRDDKVMLQSTRGIESLVSKRPLSVNSPFDLASISKQFTAYGIALLVSQGKLNLSDDVRRYIPELPDFGAKITIQHFLEHTSGIRNWDGMFALSGRTIESGISLDDIVSMAARQTTPLFQPGEQRRYNNTGYALLARVIERVSGQPFDRWTRQNIFQPLGMRSCGFVGISGVPARVSSFRASYPQPTAISTRRIVSMGSSGLTCGARDLARWQRNYMTGTLGGAGVQRLVTLPSTSPTRAETDYIFGNWLGEAAGHKRFGHQGLSAGFRTSMYAYPDDKLRIIFLANDGNDAAYQRVRVLENLFLNVPSSPLEVPTDQYVPSAGKALDDAQIRQLLGTYASPETQSSFEIVRSGQGVAARQGPGSDIPLALINGDQFSTSKWFMPRISFVRTPSGDVTGFRVESDDVGSMMFQKQR